MKSCSITELRADAYGIVEEVAHSGEEVLLTRKGKVIAKVVPLEEEGAFRPEFVAEVRRRLREEKSIDAEKFIKGVW